jgi:hypothetical protein
VGIHPGERGHRPGKRPDSGDAPYYVGKVVEEFYSTEKGGSSGGSGGQGVQGAWDQAMVVYNSGGLGARSSYSIPKRLAADSTKLP